MFDPTVFENLKVAFENQLYDLDNIAKKIRITGRIDRLDMAVMSRDFALHFLLADQQEVTAEIKLEASLKDLADEILEMPGVNPACTLQLCFYMTVDDVTMQCKEIENVLNEIWEPAQSPVQTLSFIYGQERSIYNNTIQLAFDRKINENQMEDIPELIKHILRSLDELNKLSAR
ncbi:hypothetical protein AB6A23_20600 [Paenibacillus tarimensis]